MEMGICNLGRLPISMNKNPLYLTSLQKKINSNLKILNNLNMIFGFTHTIHIKDTVQFF